MALLLESGANPHARIYGYTPAELSVKYGQQKLLPVFYARGVPKVDAETAVQIQFVEAATLQRLDDMRNAVANGAKINNSDPAGSFGVVELFSRPLLDPAGYNCVKWLVLEAGAEVNAIELSGEKNTALHNLIKRNSFRREEHANTASIAEILLERGADVSAVDSLGRTPLHYAAHHGNSEAVHVLIRHGAKVMARDAFRATPLDMAKSGEVISHLRAAGARE